MPIGPSCRARPCLYKIFSLIFSQLRGYTVPAIQRTMQEHEVQLPLNSSSFALVKPLSDELEPRMGHFSFPGRHTFETPHYIAISSRGAVPHLSQDTMKDSTSIKGIYAGLEDCKIRLKLGLILVTVHC